MAAVMTDHIQNNLFGRSTDGHRDNWSLVQIAGAGVRLSEPMALSASHGHPTPPTAGSPYFYASAP
jgi:hypothetical protein